MSAAPVRLDVGIHHNVPAAVYHADPAPRPSLSSGVARTIIAKSLAHAHAEHPRLGAKPETVTTREMDTGLLVHAILAGANDEIEVGEFDDYRTKAAREWAAGIRAAGGVPVLSKHYAPAVAIADAVRTKANVGTTDDPFGDGYAEVTAIWSKGEPSAKTYFRARFDRLVMPQGEPWTCWDWKVTSDVSTEALVRKIASMGYHYQVSHYLDGMDHLCPAFAGRHAFILCFVEDAHPYSVRRVCLSESFLGIARIGIGRAHDLWAHALKTNKWPDLTSHQTSFLQAPGWLAYQLEN